jgi:integrase/recombinase XerD
VALQCPPALQLAHQILAIPMQSFDKALIGILSRDEVQALLVAPDKAIWCGRYGLVMFSLRYNTGARVSEMLGILVADIMLAASSSVRLFGKARKQRTARL